MAEQENRLRKLTAGGYTAPPFTTAATAPADHSAAYYELKKTIHDRLLDLIDLTRLDTLGAEQLRAEIRRLVEQILGEQRDSIPLNLMERERLFREIEDEVLGFGPLEPFLKDPGVSDILVNTYAHIYVERKGKLELTEGRFKDNNHLRRIIEKIVSPLGRRIDESSPMVDARLADGSRVNAIIPPLAIDGPILSIRRFAVDPLEMDDLITLRTLTPDIGDFLKAILRARLNVLISGGTGSGKTTLLNVLSRFIPFDERIVTIEDSAELQLKQKHVVRLETRPPNIEGKGEITQRDLVRNSLRMRPDRIIVGEVRGIEVLDMLQAMNTGHDGSLTTIHANSARDALIRIETLVALTGVGIDALALRRYISAALNVVIHVARHGRRQPQDHQPARDHRHGGRRDHDEPDLRLRADPGGRKGVRARALPRQRRQAEVHGAARGEGHHGAPEPLRSGARDGTVSMDNPLLFGVLVFVGFVLLIEGGYLALRAMRQRGSDRVRRRLRRFVEQHREMSAADITRQRVYSEVPWFNAFLKQLAKGQQISLLIEQANAPYTIGFYLLLTALLGALGMTLAVIFPPGACSSGSSSR